MGRTRTPPQQESADVVALSDVVEQLRDEVKFLRQAIDEFREDFTHCLRNLPDNLPPPYAHLGTMLSAFTNESVPCSHKEDVHAGEEQSTIVDEEERGDAQETRDTDARSAADGAMLAPVVPPPVLPTPVISTPAKTLTQQVAATKSPARNKKHKQPLYMRMVFQPLLTQIIRLTGYERWTTEHMQERLKSLLETYEREAVNEAVAELLVCEKEDYWRLTDDVLKHVAQILGKRKAPSPDASSTISPSEQTFDQSQLPPSSVPPSTEAPNKSPKTAFSQEEVRNLHDQHLKTIKQRKRSLPKSIHNRFLAEHLTMPDVVLGDKSFLSLILLRPELSAKEESDMHRWVELMETHAEASVEWPRQDGDRVMWHSTVIASNEEENDNED